MQALVTFRTSQGQAISLRSGDFIGRSWNAAWRISDPRISEAHAMVSLRGSALKLLALRGRFALGDKPVTELELAPGQRLWLTNDLEVEVVSVQLPKEVMALEGEGLPAHILSGVCSLRVEPRPSLLPGLVADAEAHLWHDGLGWVVRVRGEVDPSDPSVPVDRPLVVGDHLQIGQRSFRAVTVALALAGHMTTLGVGQVDAPLTLTLRYDSAQISRDGAPALALGGISARILSELADVGQALSWEGIGKEIWPDEDDLIALRRKWDASLARLRQKLRDARIRADLVKADGNGLFMLFLYPGDRVDLAL